jgi:phosphopantetheine--protein transferase-like protein
MSPPTPQHTRYGLDTVELARVERLLHKRSPAELRDLFTPRELEDAGSGPGRTASLAARFAAKEACLKLFPRETTLGLVQAVDFSVHRNGYGEPLVSVSSNAQAVLDHHRVGGLRVSLTHTETVASAIVWADPRETTVPWYGRLLYHLLPYRRAVVLNNLGRVFGHVLPKTEIVQLAQAYYAHYLRFLVEFVRQPFMSSARRQAWVKVQNIESPLQAHSRGKGVFLLTGHFGNFEVATVAGIARFPQYRGLLYFVRRALKPAWFNSLITWRFRRAGFGTLPKRGSLDAIFDVLKRGGIIVYVFDQHAAHPDGIAVDFFGYPAGTFKSLAILALETGAPVVPASSWREPDGTHVIRFEDPLPLLECEDDPGEAIRLNTRAYNAALERMLLRHPEQWIWMHRRWKLPAATQSPPAEIGKCAERT